MDKQFFKGILPLVNDRDQYNSLKDYAKARIAHYHSLLETTKEHQPCVGNTRCYR
jgi:hemoglobin-like flavoprotein